MRFQSRRWTIGIFSIAALLVFAGASQAADRSDRGNMLGCAVRIRYERIENNSVITGHGTAFAVDLSAWGRPGKRLLLTAAHNVLEDQRRSYGTLKVEINEGTRTYWSQCKVVLVDADLDICLVESGDDIPNVCELSDYGFAVGQRVVMAGSPRGVPVGLYEGSMIGLYYQGSARAVADIKFDHGCSGGPLFNADTGKAIGVAVAGIPKDGDLDHTKGLFVPIEAVASFLAPLAKGAAPRVQQSKVKPVAAASIAKEEIPAPAPVVPNPIVASAAPAPVAVTPPVAPVAPVAPAPAPVEVAKVERVEKAKLPEPTSSVSQAAQRRLMEQTPAVAQKPVAPAVVEKAPVVAEKAPAVTAPVQETAAGEFLEPTPRQVKAEVPAVYMIEDGDSLSRIARKFNVTISALMTLNNIKDPNRILVGSKLKIH